MVLLLLLSCLIFSCLTFSWLKIWGKMTDANHELEASLIPSREPSAASDSSEEPLQESGQGTPLPETPGRAELASLPGPEGACRQRGCKPPAHQKPPRSPVSPSGTGPSPELQARGTGTQGPEGPGTNGLSPPARPLSRADEKQAHIKRQLMTNFILGSFDDNSSDEDAAASSFRESSRKGSRASLGTLSLEAASEPESHVPTMR